MRELLFAHERSETEGAKMTFVHPISLRKHFREKKKVLSSSSPPPLLLPWPLKHPPDPVSNFMSLETSMEIRGIKWKIYEWKNLTALIHTTEHLIIQLCKLASEQTNLKK